MPAPPAAPQGATPGWSAPPPKRGGCGKALGCLAIGGALVVAALVGIMLLPDSLLDDPSAAGATRAPGAATTGPATTEPTPPPAAGPLTGTITVGEGAPVLATKVKAGKAATLRAPGDGPAAGLVIEVPTGAYPEKRTFQVSAAPLDISGFDGAVTPISPLFTIDNGGGYAASPIEITIPVDIPDGSFAMGFYLHDDGSLEAIPVLEESAASITIATRHFSSLFIAMIATASLPETVGTGFRAGEDDFAAPNYGSYIAPGGHCAGQSLASMWYFSERRSQGAPQLHTLYEGVGDFSMTETWVDDRDIYRLASSVQVDQDLGLLYKAERALKLADYQRTAWLSFRYAMHVTAQPQYVSLAVRGEDGGHALVAYAYTPYGLFVADPNAPGELRSIHWNADAGRFDPYGSGPTAETSDRMYDQVMFYAKSSLIDWGRIGARWAALEDGTIGQDRFPTFSYEYLAGQDATGVDIWLPLTDGTTVPASTITIRASSWPPASGEVTVYADADRSFGVLGTFPAGWPNQGNVDLGYGTFAIGLYAQAIPKGKAESEAVDFRTIRVTTGLPPSFTPAPPAAEPTPDAGYDCSTKPKGQIEQLDWALHCEQIQTIQPAP